MVLKLTDKTGIDSSNGEVLEPLVAGSRFQLERILSFGEASPEGFWYEQSEAEWVTVIAGRAQLTIEESEGMRTISLVPGDSLELPAGQRHRVEATSDDCVWLALHFVR